MPNTEQWDPSSIALDEQWPEVLDTTLAPEDLPPRVLREDVPRNQLIAIHKEAVRVALCARL